MSGMSEIRRTIGEAVTRGAVVFRPGLAEWTIDGEKARGWVGRSLRDMLSEGLIAAPRPARITSETEIVVTLTADGSTAYRDTPAGEE